MLFVNVVFSQTPVSRATLTTTPYSWGMRLVPTLPYLQNTWASFVNIIDDGTPWSTKGNALGTNTLFIGATDNRSLIFKTNNIQRLKIDSLGIFKMAPITNTATIGTSLGEYWFNPTSLTGTGFTWYNPRSATNYFSTKTDSIIYMGDKIVRAGGVSDGYWFGTETNHNLNFAVGMTALGALPAVSIVTTSVGNGGLLINPGSTTYSTDACMRIKQGTATYAFNISNTSNTIRPFAVQNAALGSNVIMSNKCAVGSTNTPLATLDVTGSMSVSTTATLAGAVKALSTFSAGTTSTLTGKTRIGGTVAPSATLDVTGTMSVSSTSTVNGLRCIGGFSTASTFSAGTTSTLVGATRIGSSTAPSATLDVTGTMSVSSTSSLNGVFNNGALTTSTTFSAGTTSTLTGATRIGGTVAPSATLDVTGTMSVSGTSTLNGTVNNTTLSVASTATIAGNAIKTTTNTLGTAYLPTVISATATLDFGSTAAGASTDLTIALTGALDGNPVSVGVVVGSVVANGVFTAWVSAADTVKVRFTNTNLVTALDPASGVFKVVVFKN